MTLYASDIISSYVAYQNNIQASYSDMLLNNMQKLKDCATKPGSVLKVEFFGHCAKRMAAQHRFSYDFIWEFTMTLYASDIISSYVAYQNNIQASYSDMLLNNMQKLKDCATKPGSVLKVEFFCHCAKRMAAQHRFSYGLIWEFTMTLYASDIVSSYVAY